MQVKDGMSEVSLTVGPSHTLREAAAMMVEKGTGAALVSDAESPTPGIVTERDLLISIGGGEDPDVELVGEHMSERVIAAEPDWSLERAAAEMSRRGVRHLVVFEERRRGRRPLDARHRPRLDLGGRHFGHDAGLRLQAREPRYGLRAARRSSRPAARAPRTCCLRGRRVVAADRAADEAAEGGEDEDRADHRVDDWAGR